MISCRVGDVVVWNAIMDPRATKLAVALAPVRGDAHMELIQDWWLTTRCRSFCKVISKDISKDH